MRKKDRFRIRRIKQPLFKLRRSHICAVLFLIYFISLYFLPFGRNVPKPTYTLDKGITSVCVVDRKTYVSSGKTIYSVDKLLKREFAFYILKMKTIDDKIIVITDRVYLLDKNLKVIKEFSKKNMLPDEIYIFKNSFGIRWRDKKGLNIAFSRYNKEILNEERFLELKIKRADVFSAMFDNGDKIIMFENNGNVDVFNFDEEIVWNKNIRIGDSILFHPMGSFYEDKKVMILYWKESAGGKTLLYLLNYNGDILLKEEIRYKINGAFLYKDSLYILTKDYTIIKNNGTKIKVIPFYTPIYGKSINNNFVILWKIDTPVYNHLLAVIDERERVFMKNVDGIEITEDDIYLFEDSNIYIFEAKK